MELSDVEWGDVLTDTEGILVVEGTVGDRPCVVKRFADPEARREIDVYALLGRLGVPTLEVLGSGEDWLALEHLDESDWRPATEDDLADPEVGRALASWYASLHAAGAGRPELAGWPRESDLVTHATLDAVGRRWPELADGVAWAQARLPHLQEVADGLRETLTHNDFAWTNLTVHRYGPATLMIDFHLLGRGYRFADVRNVTAGLAPAAADAFREAYARHAGPIDRVEEDLDAELAPLVALVLATPFEERPGWAGPSYDWLAARG